MTTRENPSMRVSGGDESGKLEYESESGRFDRLLMLP